jgi:predicted MFS family arabinose efflux permease
VAWNTAWFVLQAAYVPYAMRTLGLDAGAVGFTLACYGAGMVTGAMLASRVMRALQFGGSILLGPFVSVAASFTMATTLWWPHGALAAASFFLFGAGPIIWSIASTTLRQTVTPHAVLGQVSAIFLTVNTGARPVGAALGGLIGAHYGESACLVVAAVGFVVQAVIITASPMRSLRQLPAPA